MMHFFKLTSVIPVILSLSLPVTIVGALATPGLQAQTIAQAVDSSRAEADRLVQEAEVKLQEQLYRSAAQSFEAAFTLYQELEAYEQALQVFLQLEAIYIQLGDDTRLRMVRVAAFDIQNALAQSQAGNIAEGTAPPPSMSDGFSDIRLGFNPVQIDNYITTLKQTLTQQRASNEDVRGTLFALGTAHRYRGNSDQAIAYFRESIPLEDGLAYHLWLEIGKTYLQERDYDQAVMALEEALSRIDEMRTRYQQADASSNDRILSAVYLDSNAEQIILKQEAGILSVLSLASLESGNISEAIAHAQTARANLESLDEIILSDDGVEILIETQLVLGRAFFENNQLADAEAVLTQAFESAYGIAAEPSYRALSLFGGQFGTIFYTELLAQASTHLQHVLIAQGKTEEALQAAEQSRSVGLKQQVNQRVAQSSDEGDSLESLSAEERIVQILSEKMWRDNQRHYEGILANPNLSPEDRQYYEQELANLDQAYFEDIVREQLPEFGDPETFLATLDYFTVAGGIPEPSLSPQQQQSQPLTDAFTLADMRSLAQSQNSTIVQYSVIPAGAASFVPPYLRSPENRERLQQPEDAIFIWVVQPDGEVQFRSVPFPADSPLAKLITTSRMQLGVRGRGVTLERIAAAIPTDMNHQRTLQSIHQLLIQPIADFLPNDPTQHVVIVPDPSLFLVPFPALQNEAGEYLIDRHTLVVNPSMQMMAIAQEQQATQTDVGSTWSGSEVLVVGNPTMPSLGEPPQPLPALPGADLEADRIANQFNAQAIKGASATKATVLTQMAQARLIHFATHGILDDVQATGLPGAIALSPSSVDDGWLTATEIADLNLQAELVVLSACDTGGGVVTSDGIVGLSRSFFEAGVPTVVASLWSVPDAPTADLMVEFYRQLQQTPDKAQALRQAMLITRQTHPHPINWAGFTLLGRS